MDLAGQILLNPHVRRAYRHGATRAILFDAIAHLSTICQVCVSIPSFEPLATTRRGKHMDVFALWNSHQDRDLSSLY